MDRKTKINFILPFKPRRPAGGFRVMYEYANRLVKDGYDVHLTYPITTKYMDYRFPYIVRLIMSKIEGFRTNQWFTFDSRISMSYVTSVKEDTVVDADIVIATWWSIVLEMGELSNRKGHKINLIQGFENWTGHEDLLFSSYNMKNTTNVVVASFLKNIVEKHTKNRTEVIENGIDHSTFYIKNKIEDRFSATVAMTYSVQEIKGSVYGLEALKIVKEKIPDLKAQLFGICPTPDNLPEWITYYRQPDNIADVYNQNAIFISNSLTEGFGLVSVESMFCGCSLICTDIDGHKEYAIDNATALLVDVKNTQQMAEKIIYLIENNEERIALAKRGNKFVQRFKWDNAIDRMKVLISSLLDK